MLVRFPSHEEAKLQASLGPYYTFIEALQYNGALAGKPPVQTLVGSRGFREFLNRKGIDIAGLDAERAARLVREYLDNFFSRYDPESLAQLQRQALRRSLSQHGLIIPKGMDPRKALEEQSKINSRYIKSRLGVRENYTGATARRVRSTVDRISLIAQHFGNNLQDAVTTPLMSSRQLSKLGLGKYAINTRAFNHRTGSDDNVFFFPLFTLRNSPNAPPIKVSYGRYSLQPKEQYFRETGWVSAFLMYPSHMPQATGFHFPATAQQAVDLAHQLGALPNQIPPILDGVLKKLYAMDFTMNDFEELAREVLNHHLNQLSKENPREFERVMRALNDQKQVSNIVKKYVYAPLGLKNDDTMEQFEVKIPVIVPRNQIEFSDRLKPGRP